MNKAKSSLPVVPETAEYTDTYAGAQLRAARTALGWSQSKLGEAAGVSFQQVQKYERGINRIAFSTLQKFATALNFPIEHFLHDTPAALSLATSQRADDYLASNSLGAAELLRLYEALDTDEARQQVLQLARLLQDRGVGTK